MLNVIFFTALAMFCVEFTTLSQPLILVNPVGYLFYGVVFAVLLDMVIRFDLRDFRSYYLLGIFVCLLTETFITKVLWHVPWRGAGDPLGFRVGGFGVLDTLVLTFFLHPVMAFAVPVMLGNYFFGYPNPRGAPSAAQVRGLLIFLPLYLIINTALVVLGLVPLPLAFLLGAGLVSFLVLGGWIFASRKVRLSPRAFTPRQAAVAWGLLVLVMGGAYFTVVPYRPSLGTLALTFVLLGIIAGLNALNIKNRSAPQAAAAAVPSFRWDRYALYGAASLAVAALAFQGMLMLGKLGCVTIFYVVWFGGMICGTVYFLWVCFQLIKGAVVRKGG